VQTVIAIPPFVALSDKQKKAKLMQPVAGVPLLKRTILTASRAGASDILLICPAALGHQRLQKFSQTVFEYGSRVRVIQLDKFNPRDFSTWAKL